jgi:plasmid stabilization system protein ParE
MREYRLLFTELAQQDLYVAKNFYEEQACNLGDYFIDSILVDLESLKFYGGIHAQYFGYYRMLAKRFPFAIYYDMESDTVMVHAIFDTRQNPLFIKERLDK